MYPQLDEKKVLFITQPCMFRGYTGTRINAATQVYPIQAFLWLSGWLKRLGLKTIVFDMGVRDAQMAICWKELVRYLLAEKPKYIGMTVTTPLYYESKLIGMVAKQVLGPDVVIVHGGVHASALFQESLTDSMCDVVVIGEGEITFGEVCQGKPLKEIQGIAYREDGDRQMLLDADQIIGRLEKGEEAYFIQKDAVASMNPVVKQTAPRPFMSVSDLDNVPFQDLDLYDIRRYRNPKIIAKSHPLIQFETSRGCPFRCNFCSAENEYRPMSPDRVIEELKYYHRYGIKEVRFNDDQFLVDVNRGMVIAEKILEAGLRFDINFGNGVRADRCTKEFLKLFKRAGLYQLGAGFESGDEAALASINKKLAIDKSVAVMRLIREMGVEVVGFFMIGTPGDTIASMQRTIDFAKQLMPDFAKVTICIPFPDTALYAEYEKKGLIKKPQRWDHYNIHKAAGVYTHPNPELTADVLYEWYLKFYSEYYKNPRYIARQLVKSISNGSILWKGATAARTFFPGIFKTSPMDNLKANYKG